MNDSHPQGYRIRAEHAPPIYTTGDPWLYLTKVDLENALYRPSSYKSVLGTSTEAYRSNLSTLIAEVTNHVYADSL